MSDTPSYQLYGEGSRLMDKKGSIRTRKARRCVLGRLSKFMGSKFRLTSFTQVRSAHVQAFMDDYLDDGNSIRTARNVMAHFRFFLRKCGRGSFSRHPHVSNATLGIAGGSRDGVKQPVTNEEAQDFFRAAGEKDVGVGLVLELGYYLGLRVLEAVMSGPDLARWSKKLQQETQPLPTLFVTRGVKGGRHRQVPVQNVAITIDLLTRAHAYCRGNGGVLIAGLLPRALSHLYDVVRDVGMVAEHSPHCLRYSYCCELLRHLHAEGWAEKDALAYVANALGHGAGRTTWVKQVYGRTVRDLWVAPTGAEAAS